VQALGTTRLLYRHRFKAAFRFQRAIQLEGEEQPGGEQKMEKINFKYIFPQTYNPQYAAHRRALRMRVWLLLGALSLGLLSGCAARPAVESSPAPNPGGVDLAPAESPSPAVVERPQPTADCIIKPVMSDEDYYKCGAMPPKPAPPRQRRE
jgi:hypothetical protein